MTCTYGTGWDFNEMTGNDESFYVCHNPCGVTQSECYVTDWCRWDPDGGPGGTAICQLDFRKWQGGSQIAPWDNHPMGVP